MLDMKIRGIPIPGLRIRDVYPGSDFFLIRIKEFKYFNPKNLFLSSRKYDPSFSSRIQVSKRDWILDPDPQH
jgi:hypothetical protein